MLDNQFLYPERIFIENDVYIGPDAKFSTSTGIMIKDRVMCGTNVVIMGLDHRYDIIGKHMRFIKELGKSGEIIIEKNVWIGPCVVILKGLKIGAGSIIGVGSVVTKSISPYVIAFGNPCKLYKKSFSKHLSLLNFGGKYIERIIQERNKYFDISQ